MNDEPQPAPRKLTPEAERALAEAAERRKQQAAQLEAEKRRSRRAGTDALW